MVGPPSFIPDFFAERDRWKALPESERLAEAEEFCKRHAIAVDAQTLLAAADLDDDDAAEDLALVTPRPTLIAPPPADDGTISTIEAYIGQGIAMGEEKIVDLYVRAVPGPGRRDTLEELAVLEKRRSHLVGGLSQQSLPPAVAGTLAPIDAHIRRLREHAHLLERKVADAYSALDASGMKLTVGLAVGPKLKLSDAMTIPVQISGRLTLDVSTRSPATGERKVRILARLSAGSSFGYVQGQLDKNFDARLGYGFIFPVSTRFGVYYAHDPLFGEIAGASLPMIGGFSVSEPNPTTGAIGISACIPLGTSPANLEVALLVENPALRTVTTPVLQVFRAGAEAVASIAKPGIAALHVVEATFIASEVWLIRLDGEIRRTLIGAL